MMMIKTMYEKRQQRGYNINQARTMAKDMSLYMVENTDEFENFTPEQFGGIFESWFWIFFDRFEKIDKEIEEKYPIQEERGK